MLRSVLITNNSLNARAGSELYVRDLAAALRARGVPVLAYSTLLGDVAAELRLLTVPVTDDLSTVSEFPEVIHGQHHLDTMTALQTFPDAAAVYVCHGFLPWEEEPPRHPRIYRYVAVDDTVRDRLVFEHGIPPERVEVLLNFVDLARFPARSPLPEKPRRALLLSNEVTPGPALDALTKACSEREIELTTSGLGSSISVRDPGPLFADYDLVFARARTALEALAVGCAVIPIGVNKFGSLVTAANVDSLRRLNFGIRSVQEPLSVEGLLREIDRFDRDDAASVTRTIRTSASIDLTVTALESLYDTVLAEHRMMPRDPEKERHAVATYLRYVSRSVKGTVAGLNHAPALLSRLKVLESELHDARAETDSVRAELSPVASHNATLQSRLGEMQSLELETARLRTEQTLERERATRSEEERLMLRNDLAAFRELFATLRQELTLRESEVTTFREVVATLRQQHEILESELREHRRTLRSRAVNVARKLLWKK